MSPKDVGEYSLNIKKHTGNKIENTVVENFIVSKIPLALAYILAL